jgi:hypothetical protein
LTQNAILILGSMLLTAAPSAAHLDEQDVIPSHRVEIPGFVAPVDPLTETQRMAELQKWVQDYSDWRQWSEKWQNKTESGWLAARQRKARPDPPEWLAEDCEGAADEPGFFSDACRLFAEWRDDPAAAVLRDNLNAERKRLEAQAKSNWWRHVHYDGFWPMTQSSSGGAIGVFGVHATMDVVGGFQVFVTPGAMLMRLPTPNGGQEWRPAPVWGVSYRLLNFRLPGTQKAASLHANLVRAWVSMNVGNVRGNTTVNLAGFSISLK